jgi:hypothetical protein
VRDGDRAAVGARRERERVRPGADRLAVERALQLADQRERLVERGAHCFPLGLVSNSTERSTNRVHAPATVSLNLILSRFLPTFAHW